MISVKENVSSHVGTCIIGNLLFSMDSKGITLRGSNNDIHVVTCTHEFSGVVKVTIIIYSDVRNILDLFLDNIDKKMKSYQWWLFNYCY